MPVHLPETSAWFFEEFYMLGFEKYAYSNAWICINLCTHHVLFEFHVSGLEVLESYF